jgi:type IVB pilus formation R64 PilN family outer membrane protein
MKTHLKIVALAISAIAGLSGCADGYVKSSAEVEQMQHAASSTYGSFQRHPTTPSYEEVSTAYFNPRPIIIKDDAAVLPPIFSAPIQVTLNPRESLKGAVQILYRNTGIPVSIAQEIANEMTRPLVLNGFTTDPNETVAKFLDRLTRQADVYWKYADGRVQVFRTDTRIFKIAAARTTTKFSSKISNTSSLGGSSGGSGGGSGGGSSGGGGATSSSGQDATIDSKSDFYADMPAQVKPLLTPLGHFSVSQNSGLLTVTDTPEGLAAVERYVKEINDLKSRNVRMDVELYLVDSTKLDSYAAQFNPTFLGHNLGISSTPGGAAAAAGASSFSFTVANPTSPSKGTSEMIAALNSLTGTDQRVSINDIVQSGTLLPFSRLQEQTYIASASTTQTANVGTSSSITPATVVYGTVFQFQPDIIDGDHLSIHMAYDISALDSLDTFTSDGSTAQEPNRSSQATSKDFNVKNGQTAVFGIRMNNVQFTKSGTGSTDNPISFLIGGERQTSGRATTLVVLITPTIVND